MPDVGAPAPESLANLRAYFRQNGLLLCNESRELPSRFTVGGDWNAVVALIESGEVFYSRLYKGRVTYLSRDFYYAAKPFRRRAEKLSPAAGEAYAFLSSVESASTKEIKQSCLLSSKAYTQAMNELGAELLATALRRDQTMLANWSSFLWGTAACWEALHPPEASGAADAETVRAMLASLLTEKQIAALLPGLPKP